MLTEIRKKLKLYRSFLHITSSGESKLINRGVYFTTDFDELKSLIIQAKVFERAEEWRFALHNYILSLSLVRGRPFEKLFDNWSEEMRRSILIQIGEAVSNTKKICFKDNGNLQLYNTLKKTIPRLIKILPNFAIKSD